MKVKVDALQALTDVVKAALDAAVAAGTGITAAEVQALRYFLYISI